MRKFQSPSKSSEMSTMTDCFIPESLSILKVLMISRKRSEAQAADTLKRLHEEHNPQTTSELVGCLVDQLIDDLCWLERRKDHPLERRNADHPA